MNWEWDGSGWQLCGEERSARYYEAPTAWSGYTCEFWDQSSHKRFGPVHKTLKLSETAAREVCEEWLSNIITTKKTLGFKQD